MKIIPKKHLINMLLNHSDNSLITVDYIVQLFCEYGDDYYIDEHGLWDIAKENPKRKLFLKEHRDGTN